MEESKIIGYVKGFEGNEEYALTKDDLQDYHYTVFIPSYHCKDLMEKIEKIPELKRIDQTAIPGNAQVYTKYTTYLFPGVEIIEELSHTGNFIALGIYDRNFDIHFPGEQDSWKSRIEDAPIKQGEDVAFGEGFASRSNYWYGMKIDTSRVLTSKPLLNFCTYLLKEVIKTDLSMSDDAKLTLQSLTDEDMGDISFAESFYKFGKASNK